jgi:hypothetical protein
VVDSSVKKSKRDLTERGLCTSAEAVVVDMRTLPESYPVCSEGIDAQRAFERAVE